MPRRFAPVLSALAAFAAVPAQDGETKAPPGNSAIDECVETIPGAAGDRTPRAGRRIRPRAVRAGDLPRRRIFVFAAEGRADPSPGDAQFSVESLEGISDAEVGGNYVVSASVASKAKATIHKVADCLDARQLIRSTASGHFSPSEGEK